MATESPLDIRASGHEVTGRFVDLFGQRHYAVDRVDRMPAFFMSVVSHADHWLFASSNGGLTAGRKSADFALFPYVTVDKIHDSATHTGCLTLLRVHGAGRSIEWMPFDPNRHPDAPIRRTLYKAVSGNSVCFEETHVELGLQFRYRWQFSGRWGFVRDCALTNLSHAPVRVELLDGLRNLLPAGTPRFAQTNTSNLVDAYKWNELDAETGLACYTLYSGITDRAEPAESLRANTVFRLGLDDAAVLLTERQLDRFRAGEGPAPETRARGQRGCYLVSTHLSVGAGETHTWRFVADVEQDQVEVAALRASLADGRFDQSALDRDIARGTSELVTLMAGADGLQATAQEHVTAHHYANVLFNVLRGGTADHHYDIAIADLLKSLRAFNRALAERHGDWLQSLPSPIDRAALMRAVAQRDDPQLERLCLEYLPFRFGRRHGDPSRPWNQFTIDVAGDDGERVLAYEGNWRDIFQNWEALAFSYPDFIESMIAKFVNASTADGYNPYRITDDGIDWEVEEPDDPWSYIGYWGDHQIIYLQKLLELSRHFHPERLSGLLHRRIFCYANVPYRIKPFEALVDDAKNTVVYDEPAAEEIERRVEAIGNDGKLILDESGEVCRVTLIEKLLVPLLGKLGNLVLDGGIWMNTQRPEWNDANNALVGQGASLVTLCYLRRYVTFARDVLGDCGAVTLTAEVSEWLEGTARALAEARRSLGAGAANPGQRFELLRALGEAASRCRGAIYRNGRFGAPRELDGARVRALLDDALALIDRSIDSNRRDDGMYHAYNLIRFDGAALHVDHLYPMLEGQVAALSAGSLSASDVVDVLDGLFASDVYRPDQRSFMLYPDRDLPAFLERNCVPADAVAGIELVTEMLQRGDDRLIARDVDGRLRFHADLANAGALGARLDELVADYGARVTAARDAVLAAYERVFHHQAFTGRSGTMFGFEGLGSIYWHMVAKLLLAIQENVFDAIANDVDPDVVEQLKSYYYRVRDGLGFNKSPAEYGAFPADPYSHTPAHVGAQQPGMTGQVKEEILTRFGELGIRVSDGGVAFQPVLLTAAEFCSGPRAFEYVDVDDEWRSLSLGPRSLAFTWCQVPIVFRLVDESEGRITLTNGDGTRETVAGLRLAHEACQRLSSRAGLVRQADVEIPRALLYERRRTV